MQMIVEHDMDFVLMHLMSNLDEQHEKMETDEICNI